MAKDTYDLVVLGSGPGGCRAAVQAAKLGKKVVIIEKDKAGGSCVHTGTVPSKSLREAALDQSDNFGKAMARMQKIVAEEAKVVTAQLKRNHVDFLKGTAAFTGLNEVEVKGEKIRGHHFVIATGTRPLRSKEFPFQLPTVHDSDSILKWKKLPTSLLVLGAGVIGCEYASIFARLGCKVTLVDRRAELLRSVDLEVIEALRTEFADAGVELILSAEIGPIEKGGTSGLKVKIGKRTRSFAAALVCMGRQPNTENLGLDSIGVQLDPRGYIQVDRQSFRTNVPHIYAVGDVIGPPALAASSGEQGRIASCRIFQEPCRDFPASFPYGIYTIPEISQVGLLETELRERKIPYVVGRAKFAELARGLIVGDQNGFIKILVHGQTRKILGVHAIGNGATELVHIGQTALALEAPVDFLVDNVFNYPTFAEAYKVAALHAANQLKT